MLMSRLTEVWQGQCAKFTMLTLIISKIKNSPIEIDSMFSRGPPNNNKLTQSLILSVC